MKKTALKKTILTALFAALIAAGAFIRIPLPPVPITLQTLFALCAGLLLPVSVSLSSVLVYLFLGAVGLPIFTSGGGIAALTGPTGGYLIGLIPAVIVAGLMMKKKDAGFAYILLTALLATIALYIPGLAWLGYSRSLSFTATLTAGLVPFIVGDVIKLLVASAAALKVRGQVDTLLTEEEE